MHAGMQSNHFYVVHHNFELTADTAGKDFKALAPFVIWDELDSNQKDLWLSLSKVNIFHTISSLNRNSLHGHSL